MTYRQWPFDEIPQSPSVPLVRFRRSQRQVQQHQTTHQLQHNLQDELNTLNSQVQQSMNKNSANQQHKILLPCDCQNSQSHKVNLQKTDPQNCASCTCDEEMTPTLTRRSRPRSSGPHLSYNNPFSNFKMFQKRPKSISSTLRVDALFQVNNLLQVLVYCVVNLCTICLILLLVHFTTLFRFSAPSHFL